MLLRLALATSVALMSFSNVSFADHKCGCTAACQKACNKKAGDGEKHGCKCPVCAKKGGCSKANCEKHEDHDGHQHEEEKKEEPKT
jgi:hypothetical protein